MTNEQRNRAAALLVLMHVLEEDYGESSDSALIQEINTEVCCLTLGYSDTAERGSILDVSTTYIIRMLMVGDAETRQKRAKLLLCTSLELARNNQLSRS